MMLKTQVTLNDTEIKQALANYMEASGVRGASAQADSLVIRVVKSPVAGFMAVLDVTLDTDEDATALLSLAEVVVAIAPVEAEVTIVEKVALEVVDLSPVAEDLPMDADEDDEEISNALDMATITNATALFKL